MFLLFLVQLSVLQRLLQDVSHFARAQAAQGFLTTLFQKHQRIARIEVYHRRVVTSVSSFQVRPRTLKSHAD
jgi:hypothetical protein